MASVVEQTPYNEYTADGVATVYPYEFHLLDADDLVVTVDGVVIPASDFTLSGVGVQAGGDVTFDVAPATGALVLLLREIALQRDIDYQNNGDLRSPTVNLDFNRLWQALQGMWSRVTGSVRAPFPEQLSELPDRATRANTILAFDSNGDPTVSVPVSGSAADVLTQLANGANANLGADLVAYNPTLSYAGSGRLGKFLNYLFARTLVEIAAGVTPANYAYPFGLIERYGAVGDDSTNDTAAATSWLSLLSVGVRSCYLRTTPGRVYRVGDLNLVAPNLTNNSRGEYGGTIDFRGSTFKGLAGATRVLLIGADTGTTTWTNGVEVLGGTLDMSLMTDASTCRGIEVRNAYKGKIEGVSVLGEGANKIGLYFRDRAYTTSINNVSMLRCNVVGANVASDAVTTLSFKNPDIAKLTLTRCSTIRVSGGAIQSSSGNKVDMSEVYDITFNEVDIEGAAGTAYAMGSACSYVRVNGGNISSGLTKVSGEGTGCRFATRGEYGRTQGSEAQITSSSTSPNVIWTFAGDTTSAGVPIGFGLFVVQGVSASDGFCDLVSVAAGIPHAETTRTKYGAPATRTYSWSGTSLRVAMGSATTINISTVNLWNPR